MTRQGSRQPVLPPAQAAQGSPRTSRHRDGTIATGILLALLLVYHLNRDFQYIGDAEGNIYLPVSLLTEGNVSFRPSEAPVLFSWTMHTPTRPEPYRVTQWSPELERLYRSGVLVMSHPNYSLIRSSRTDPAHGEPLFVNTFGPGAGLTALPFVSLVYVAVGDLRDHPRLLWFTAKSVASFLVAASAAFIYLASRRALEPLLAALIAVSYGLGTCVWSTSTQTLWQHAPNEFFLALGCYAFFRATGTVSAGGRQCCAATVCGAAFACATVCRPTSGIVLVTIAAYLAVTDRRSFGIYALAALPIAVALGAYNAYFLGSPWNFGQAEIGRKLALAKTGSVSLWQTPLWLGLAGLLISPSRGLLVFSPFLGFALAGIVRAWRRREFAQLRPLTVALGLLLIVEAKHFDWWGGWSYGYRHIVDTAVFFALLLIPVAPWLVQRRWRLATYAILLGWSVLVQIVGAFAYDGYGWNARLVGYTLRLPGRSEPLVVDNAEQARSLVATRGAAIIGQVRLDIDQPQHRHRLWSLRDNQIAYYLSHFAEGRRTKLDAVAQFDGS